MAKIENGILGPFRGRVGNVIGYVRNGVGCVRSMPRFYHDRKSAAQLKNRNRFTMVMKVMSAVRPAIGLGFRRFAVGMTEMNVATRMNYYGLVTEGAAGLEYCYAGLMLSRGRVERLGGAMMNRSGKVLRLVWDGNGNGVMGGEEDQVTVVVLNAERMEARLWRGAGRRSAGVARVEMPEGWQGEEMHCYVMVERGGEWSDSEYVGRLDEGRMERWSGDEDVEADNEWDTGMGEDRVSSDQSAIKVLSESGLNGTRTGLDEPPEGVRNGTGGG